MTISPCGALPEGGTGLPWLERTRWSWGGWWIMCLLVVAGGSQLGLWLALPVALLTCVCWELRQLERQYQLVQEGLQLPIGGDRSDGT